ncbi:MAG TPA: hypothetical protein VM123_16705 [archaeon]|nr:hypothetical protein [archaeon]
MALCAPRPLFNYSARKDDIFPSWWAVYVGLKQVAEVYRLLGAADCFSWLDGEGGHDFPPQAREQAYFGSSRLFQLAGRCEGGHDFPPQAREQAYLWLDKWLVND